MSPLYVLSTSTETAARHAEVEGVNWFHTEHEARDWLAGCDADMRALFRVYRCDWTGARWIAREPLTVAGIAARCAGLAAGFAGLACVGGILTIIERLAS